MSHWLSKRELASVAAADEAAFDSPVPTQIVSNGEYNPLPQTAKQRQVEARIKELSDSLGRKLGMDRRSFLRSSCGMAAAFLAMNEVFGPVFKVARAETRDPAMSQARAETLRHQFILDAQTHFVRDDFNQEGLLGLADFAAEHWNPELKKEKRSLYLYKFENYVREVFVDSDTDVAILSDAPFDDPSWRFLGNEQMARAREAINGVAGSRRLLSHAVFRPGQDGWMDEVDAAIEVHRPDSWKGYTIGDPLTPTTRHPWRLDDEKLVYPFYEKAQAAGITTICVHKGLLPSDYEKSWPEVWKYATVDDVGKAAKDWPGLTFVMYHSALQPFTELPDANLAEFERTGYIRWSSDLAAIPERFGVDNVYAEVGTAFANSAVVNPRFCAAFMGTLIKGLGAHHVLWGTDSVFYGSPQWQIEAFRRLEIPDDMQKKWGFAPVGEADSNVKNMIFGLNTATLYKLNLRAGLTPLDADKFAAIRRDYRLAGGFRSNKRYGYVAKAPA